MFLTEITREHRTTNFITCASFHMGVPLVLATSGNWERICGAIKKELRASKDTKLRVFERDFVPFFRFPLGEPISLAFTADQALKTAFTDTSTCHNYFDHRIWITPAGGVFIHLHTQCDQADTAAFAETPFEEYAANYDVLTCLFLEVFSELHAVLSKLRMEFDFAGSELLMRNETAMKQTALLRDAFFRTDGNEVGDFSTDIGGYTPEDLLYDVYYIRVTERGDHACVSKVDYTKSDIAHGDYNDVYSVLIIYTGFATSLWVMNSISDYSRDALSVSLTSRGVKRLFSVSAMKVFCETFIAEYRPIQVRISERYLKTMENAFQEYGMERIFSQLSTQLKSLTEEVHVIESRLQAERDRRISFGASAIAVLAAVSAGYDLLHYFGEISHQTLTFRYFLPAWMVSLTALFVAVLYLPRMKGRDGGHRLFK